MLTRLEVRNFKTFDDFAVVFDPFAVVLGPNAAGKSNLFDALRLLSALASGDVSTAMQTIRGRPHELFRDADRPIRLACEVLLDPAVIDPFGQRYELGNSRLRYEVEVMVRLDRRVANPFVVHERVARLTPADDRLRRGAARSEVHPRYSLHKDYLATINRAGSAHFVVSQDGKQGRGREVPATAASATMLSTIRDATYVHLFALAEELRSWRFLQFDPSVLRQPSDESMPADRLSPDGSNLARVLGRVVESGHDGVVKEIADELNELIGGIEAIEPRYYPPTRQWELLFSTTRDGEISARVVSDGTMRLTALLTAILDPAARGLICFEEPENGVHPQRLHQLMQLLHRFTTDLTDQSEVPPLRQVIVNSHSPVVLASVPVRSVYFADRVTRVGGGATTPSYVTRLRPVEPGFVALDLSNVTELEVQQYLEQARTHQGV